MAGRMAQAGSKKSSEWYFGVHHEDVLDSTLKARERAQRRLVASLGGGGDKKTEAEKAASKGAKIAIPDLIRILRDVIQARYDDIFDAFTDVDLNSNGRIKCVSSLGVARANDCLRAPRNVLA